VPTTTPARIICDLAPAIGRGFLGRLVDSSLPRRITTLSELRAVEDLLGVPSLRAVLEAREPGYHPGDSDREVDLARVLVEAGLPPAVPQHQVAVGGTVYLLDLSYPLVRLAIEYDGWDTHRTRSAFDHDRRRANALALAGWTLLSFTSASDRREIAATAAAAYERCGRDCPPSVVNVRDAGGKVAGP
jgi:very-short-patch-repair endonuclease